MQCTATALEMECTHTHTIYARRYAKASATTSQHRNTGPGRSWCASRFFNYEQLLVVWRTHFRWPLFAVVVVVVTRDTATHVHKKTHYACRSVVNMRACWAAARRKDVRKCESRFVNRTQYNDYPVCMSVPCRGRIHTYMNGDFFVCTRSTFYKESKYVKYMRPSTEFVLRNCNLNDDNEQHQFVYIID